jgi:hypothetical protein
VTTVVVSGSSDITVDQGAGFEQVFIYYQSVPAGPPSFGPPFDVTGWSAKLQVRRTYASGPLLTLTDGDGILVGTTDGSFTVQMTGEQTQVLDSGVWDLVVTPPDQQPIHLIGGNVIFNQSAVR